MTAPATLRPADILDGFAVPPELEATRPPETRGIRRDQVRLMVTDTDGIRHRAFRDLPSELRSGDLVVVNNSATLPASVVIDADLVVHFSTVLPGGLHVVELRRLSGANSLPHEDPRAGTLTLPGGGSDRAAHHLSGGCAGPPALGGHRRPRPTPRRLSGDLGSPHPLPAHRWALPAGCLPDDLRPGSRVGRDAQCRKALHGPPDHGVDHGRRRRGPFDPAHGCLLARRG